MSTEMEILFGLCFLMFCKDVWTVVAIFGKQIAVYSTNKIAARTIEQICSSSY